MHTTIECMYKRFGFTHRNTGWHAFRIDRMLLVYRSVKAFRHTTCLLAGISDQHTSVQKSPSPRHSQLSWTQTGRETIDSHRVAKGGAEEAPWRRGMGRGGLTEMCKWELTLHTNNTATQAVGNASRKAQRPRGELHTNSSIYSHCAIVQEAAENCEEATLCYRGGKFNRTSHTECVVFTPKPRPQ